MSLVITLFLAYVLVMGVVALVTGWRSLRTVWPSRYRRGVVVPPAHGTGQGGGAR